MLPVEGVLHELSGRHPGGAPFHLLVDVEAGGAREGLVDFVVVEGLGAQVLAGPALANVVQEPGLHPPVVLPPVDRVGHVAEVVVVLRIPGAVLLENGQVVLVVGELDAVEDRGALVVLLHRGPGDRRVLQGVKSALAVGRASVEIKHHLPSQVTAPVDLEGVRIVLREDPHGQTAIASDLQ